jgi:hypothetical protein
MTIANQIISFKLSGINYVGTSTQLNYTAGVTAGVSVGDRALVLDTNKSAIGISSLTVDSLIATNSIAGVLATSSQPNITNLGILLGLNINGVLNLQEHDGATKGLQLNGNLVTASAVELNYLSGSTVGTAVGGKTLVVNTSRNINNLNLISCASISISNTLTINNVNVTSSANQLNYVNTTPGATEATKALIVDASKNISGLNTVTVNTLTSTNISGLVTSPLQTNITQLGTLTSLSMSGSVSGVVNISMSGSITGVANLSAINIAGVLTTASQPNITQLGTVLNLNVSGRTTTVNATVETLTLGSTQLNASATELNNLAGVVAGTASNGKAIVVNSTRDIVNINSITASSIISSSITGTLQTSSQSNINQVGILNSLEIAGNSHIRFLNNNTTFSPYEQWTNNLSTPLSVRLDMNNDSARFGTTSGHPIRFITNNSVSMSIENTGNVNIGSQTPTSFKLNVNGSANFTTLSIAGTSVSASASELNNLSGATAGSALSNKALVVDNNKNLDSLGTVSADAITATILTGTLSTPSQPNITQLGKLSSLTIESTSVGLIIKNTSPTLAGALRLTNDIRNIEIGIRGSGTGTTPNCLYIIDSSPTARLLMDPSGNFTIGGNVITDNKLNVVGNLNTSSLSINNISITSSSVEINYLSGSLLGSVSAGKAVIADINRDVGNIRNLSATNISGSISTSSQPAITQVGTLSGLVISGNLSGLTNLTMSGNLSGASIVSANTLTGTISTPSQINITQLGVLNNITSNGNLKIGTTASPAIDMIHVEGNNSSGLGIQIENRNITSNSTTYVKFTGFNNSNDDYDLARISCGYTPVNANYGYGYLSFSTRDNSNSSTASERMRISESGNVGIGKSNPAYPLDVVGTINCDSVRLGTSTISGTDLVKLNGITNGNAAASKALIVDENRNIGNINILSVSSVSSTTLSGTIQTAAQPNITSLGVISTLNATAIISSTISGTIQTAAQPNITSLGTVSSNLIFGSSVKIGMNSKTSPIATIDMGNFGTDRAISIFNDSISYYGIGASSSQLRYFSTGSHVWHTGTTPSSLGTSIMSLSPSGNLTVSGLQGTILTSSQPNITSLGSLSTLSIYGSAEDALFITNPSSSSRCCIKLAAGTRGYELGVRGVNKDSNISFYTYDNESNIFTMTINSSGVVSIPASIVTGSIIANGSSNNSFGRNTYSDVKVTIATNVNYALYVDNGAVSFPQAAVSRSDYRIKTEVESINKGLKEILKLRPVSYKLKTDKNNRYIGFIAHETQEYIPEIVFGEKDAFYPDGNMKLQSIAYASLTPILTKAVQEQQTLIEANFNSISSLSAKNKQLENELLILKKLFNDYIQNK